MGNTFSVIDDNNNAILDLQSGLGVSREGNINTRNIESENGFPTQLQISDGSAKTILDLRTGLLVNEQGDILTKKFNSGEAISNLTFNTCPVDLMFNKKLMQMPVALISHKIVDKNNRLVVSFNGDSIIGSQLDDITASPEYDTGAYPPNMSRMIMARQFLDRYQFEGADVIYRNLEHQDWVKSGFAVNKGKGDKNQVNSSFNEFETWGCSSDEDNASITISGYSYFKLIWSRGNPSSLWECSLKVSVNGGGFTTPSVANIQLPDTFGKPSLDHRELQVYAVTTLDPSKTYTFKIEPTSNYADALVWGCEFWNNPRLDVVIEAFSGQTARAMVLQMQEAFCSEWHKPMFMIADVTTKNDQAYIVGSNDTIPMWQENLATLYGICRNKGIPLLLFAPHRTSTEWLTYLAPGYGVMQGIATIDISKSLAEDNMSVVNIVNTTDGQHLSNAGNAYYFNKLIEIFH